MFAGWGRFVYRFRWATLVASGVLLAISVALLAMGGTLLVSVLHLAADLGEDGQHELLLGLEVVVDEALGDAGLLGDLFDRAVLVALAGEDAEGGLEDLVSGFG